MASTPELEVLRKGIVAFGLTVTYLHEEQTLRRGVAAQNLRLGLKREGLWMGSADETLFKATLIKSTVMRPFALSTA
jgi:hypothetical protein